MRYIVFVLPVFFILHCQPAAHQGLDEDATLRSIFDSQELRDLHEILDFFETQICSRLRLPREQLDSCYADFFSIVEIAQGTGVLNIPVQYHAQMDMYSRLSASAFEEIWQMGYGINAVSGDTTWSMRLNPEGKYRYFLQAVQEDYMIFQSYYEAFQSTGQMTASMIETVLYNFRLYNMEDVRVRLLIALHYLTINDSFSREGAPNPPTADGED